MLYLIVFFLIALLIATFVTSKKSLIKKNAKMKANWIQVSMIIQKRFDLVENLFKSIKECKVEAINKIIEAKKVYFFATDITSKVVIINKVEKYFKDIEKVDMICEGSGDNELLQETKKSIIKLNKDIVFAKIYYNDSVSDYRKDCKKIIGKNIAKILKLDDGCQMI